MGSLERTVFAFDEGQSISEHTAPFDALVHVLEGEVENRRQTSSSAKRRDDSHAGTATARAQGDAALQDDPHDDSVLRPKPKPGIPASVNRDAKNRAKSVGDMIS